VNLHGRPTSEELVDAVAALLRDQVSEQVDGATRHQLRIAVHALEIVARELALGPGQERAHRAGLAELGFDDDASLAQAIRSGRVEDSPQLRRVLREDTRARLVVANPKWLPPAGGG
jgi:uncharacterized protein DUF6285